jgi:formate-dependent nitrite reductase membrane component NrfD
MTPPTRANELSADVHSGKMGGHRRREAAFSEHASKTGDREAPLYYDVPMLKPPVWKWEIATYFFLGGLSAGAYVLARLARRFGPERYRDVTDAGAAIAFAAMTPCPLLLIRDLGDPKRFHYMLRVFKPKSPMNLGSWVLSGYGAMATLNALNQWRKGRSEPSGAIGREVEDRHKARRSRSQDRKQERHRSAATNNSQTVEPSPALRVADEAVEAVLDGAGLPLALLLAAYTGVLLSTTANPLWTRNNWLSPLFSAGAISSAASAVSLALEVKDGQAEQRSAHQPLRQIDTAAKVAEAITLAGYLTSAGKLAEPITKGKYAPYLWGGAVGLGIVGSTVLGQAPVKSEKTRRALRIAGAVAGVVGGLALRWAISQGGHVSGSDPVAARQSSRRETSEP